MMRNKLLNTHPKQFSNGMHTWLLLLRLAVGGFMLSHGIPKMMGLLGGNMSFADPIGIGESASLVLTVFAEVICSVCLILGFWTRLAAIPLSITMLVAAFIVHAADPFGKKEFALLYLLIYLTLLVFGGGKYSVDGRKK